MKISVKNAFTLYMTHCTVNGCDVRESDDGSFSGEKNFSCYLPLIVRVALFTPSNVFQAGHTTPLRKHENLPSSISNTIFVSCFFLI